MAYATMTSETARTTSSTFSFVILSQSGSERSRWQLVIVAQLAALTTSATFILLS